MDKGTCCSCRGPSSVPVTLAPGHPKSVDPELLHTDHLSVWVLGLQAGAQGGKKRVSGPLEFQVTELPHMGAGNQVWIPARVAHALNHARPPYTLYFETGSFLELTATACFCLRTQQPEVWTRGVGR